MTDNPYESPHTSADSPTPKKPKRRFRIVELLVVVAIIVILVALLLPATRSGGGAARRMQCVNNLKNIALALSNYEARYGSMPPAYTVDEDGNPLHSWRTLILPYMEQVALYETIDLTKPWDDPANKDACEKVISYYRCPSVECPPTHTTYQAVVASGGCFQESKPRKLSEITDDHGLTLLVVEVDAERSVPWMSPTDTTENWVLNFGTNAKLPHPGGIQAAFVDGSVQFLSSSLAPETARALISINGDDDVEAQKMD